MSRSEVNTVRRGRLFSLAPFGLWLLLAGLLGGIAGLGGFTFVYAEGGSYFSDDPDACVNCHVMREVYDGWHNGSHKAAARRAPIAMTQKPWTYVSPGRRC